MALEDSVSRDDRLSLLSSMDVKVACDTDTPLDVLEKRVDEALDACQNISCLGGASLVDPDALPKWAHDKPLLKSGARTALLHAPNSVPPPRPQKAGLSKKNTFKAMRQTLEFVAYAWNHSRSRDLVLVTSDSKHGIFIKVLGVYDLGQDTPLLFFVYRKLKSTSETPMSRLVAELPAGTEKRLKVTISELEHHAFLKLIDMNAARLDPIHQALINERGGEKFEICVSFFLPLVPLSPEAALRLSDHRCNNCGKRRHTVKLCQQCLTFAYCPGKDCSTKDSHKLYCGVLKDAFWMPITMNDIQKASMRFLPDTVIVDRTRHRTNHEGRISLARFQIIWISKDTGPTKLAVYDRYMSFVTEWHRNEQNGSFFDKVMSDGGSNFFRWVRHLSGNQYELCIDREPKDRPYW